MVYLLKLYNDMTEKWEYFSYKSECERYAIGTDYLSEAYVFDHEEAAQKLRAEFGGKVISFKC